MFGLDLKRLRELRALQVSCAPEATVTVGLEYHKHNTRTLPRGCSRLVLSDLCLMSPVSCIRQPGKCAVNEAGPSAEALTGWVPVATLLCDQLRVTSAGQDQPPEGLSPGTFLSPCVRFHISAVPRPLPFTALHPLVGTSLEVQAAPLNRQTEEGSWKGTARWLWVLSEKEASHWWVGA